MKLFLYKTLIVMFFIYIIFEITVGQRINKYEEKLDNLINERGREQIIIKIKDEIRRANEKENYFTPEDRKLLSTFIKKIQKELFSENSQ